MQAFEKLESRWASFNNLDPAGMVACASGTAALHLAFEALQLPQGSEVVCPDFNMIACPRAIAMAGLNPFLVDCDSSLNMDWEQVLGTTWSTPLLSAVLCVHIYGHRPNMDAIHGEQRMVSNYGDIPVIEDLAEAHGTKPHNRTRVACWSFYQNKIVAGQEGGAVWFRNPEHAALARQLRSLGFTAKHDFMHVPRGHNYRLSNAHAELILPSIDRYTENVYARWQQWEWLQAACPAEWRMPKPQAPWVFPLRIPGMDYERQGKVVAALQAAGIAARCGFKPMHVQPEFATCRRVGGQEAERASREVIYLPLTPNRPRIDGIAFGIIEKS